VSASPDSWSGGAAALAASAAIEFGFTAEASRSLGAGTENFAGFDWTIDDASGGELVNGTGLRISSTTGSWNAAVDIADIESALGWTYDPLRDVLRFLISISDHDLTSTTTDLRCMLETVGGPIVLGDWAAWARPGGVLSRQMRIYDGSSSHEGAVAASAPADPVLEMAWAPGGGDVFGFGSGGPTSLPAWAGLDLYADAQRLYQPSSAFAWRTHANNRFSNWAGGQAKISVATTGNVDIPRAWFQFLRLGPNP